MWGKGLIKGMCVTFKHFWGKKETFSYPEEKLPMSERFRGGHLLLNREKCIACKLCETSCPNRALNLKVTMDENKKRKMSEYIHNIGRCMYCDLCVEACPTKAISWNTNYALASWDSSDMVYDCVQESEEREALEEEKSSPANINREEKALEEVQDRS